MAAKFDSKSFNPEAFRYLVERVPNLTLNELVKSRALAGNEDIRNTLTAQNGTAFATLALRGLIDGDPLNYDGGTDITATSTKTYDWGVVVTGRAKAWTEKDFAYDITGGVDFMANIAQQVAQYKDTINQEMLLSVLKGIFAMTGAKNLEFVNGHTHDVSDVESGTVNATTLNTAVQKASGDNKGKFRIAIMHSAVATNLENLNLLEYLKYTDENGVQRDLTMGTWNGRTVLVDDAMPTEDVAASGEVPAYTKYTTYVLGEGAIAYEDIGAKVPYEMNRDPATNGGEDYLYMRQRNVFAPLGISWLRSSQSSLSPTNTELENGANWSLVHTGESTASQRTYYNHRAIPIARIISRG